MSRTHQYSCLLDSFAHILGLRPLALIDRLGHSGWEHGFHSQELIDVCLEKGLSVTLIERRPVSVNPNTWFTREVFVDHNKRFLNQIWNHRGILLGANKKGVPHAVAWEQNQIWDPANEECYSHLEADIGSEIAVKPKFVAWNFLRIDKIEHN